MGIKLELELNETESVLKHLSKGEYAEVAPLIAKIHAQAMPQVTANLQTQVSEPIIAEPVPTTDEPEAEAA